MATPDEPASIRVTRSVTIPLSEISFRVSRSRGPGGQHAKHGDTVDARFDVGVEGAQRGQKRRVAGAGAVIRAVSQDERSQARNRELAPDRLVHRLREALHKRRRVPTRPGREGAGGAAGG